MFEKLLVLKKIQKKCANLLLYLKQIQYSFDLYVRTISKYRYCNFILFIEYVKTFVSCI